MDPGSLIPSPDVLPAPWGLFEVLLVLTFFLHILAVNLLLGGGVIALCNHLRRRGSETAELVGREVSGRLPLVMALAINLGVAPFLFMQVIYGQFLYVSAVLTAVLWLSLFLLLIAAYYGFYLYRDRYQALGGMRPWPLGLAVGLVLLVGFIFSNTLVVMIDPSFWSHYFARPGGTLVHWGESSLVPRYLHFLAASVALGGLGLALWGRRRRLERLVSQGLSWYGAASIANFFIGGWYLGSLPRSVLGAAAGDDRLLLGLFMLSVILGLASIVFSFAGRLWPTLVTCLPAVLIMVIFRLAVRHAYLAPYLEPGRLPVRTQLAPVLLFMAALLAGLAVVAWLLKAAWSAKKEVGA